MNPTLQKVRSMPPRPEHVGRFARSIESGWLGKVIAVEGEFLKMQGVNELVRMIAGGSLEECLDLADTQWFTPEDLHFLKVIRKGLTRPEGNDPHDHRK